MAKSREPDAPKRKPGRPRKNPPPPPAPTPPAAVELSDDEQRFVEEYLVDRCAAAAYRRAFPDVAYLTARQNGYEIRHRPHVAAEIAAGLAAQRRRSAVRADEVIKELARIAFSDVLELFDPHTHQLRHPRHIPFDVRKAIASIKVQRERRSRTTQGRTQTTVTDQIVEYRLWPKNDALGKLMAHLGLNQEIPPLEVLLLALPSDLREQVRKALTDNKANT